jgi:hypothetical protein
MWWATRRAIFLAFFWQAILVARGDCVEVGAWLAKPSVPVVEITKGVRFAAAFLGTSARRASTMDVAIQ